MKGADGQQDEEEKSKVTTRTIRKEGYGTQPELGDRELALLPTYPVGPDPTDFLAVEATVPL